MMMTNGPGMMQQPVILLKAGTEASQGKQLLLSNIRACREIVEIVKSTLGPLGQDKLIQTAQKTHITNDGATIMDLLSVVHPAAQILVDISKAQDAEVGDGTTSVVILAGELLREAANFVEDGMNPQLIVAGYRKACKLALEYLNEIKVDLGAVDADTRRKTIQQCAETSLNSKLLNSHKELFGNLVYECVSRLPRGTSDRSLLGIKKVPGGSVEDSFWIDGVAFQKTFSYAGFENAPKAFKNPKILLLSIELELKAEKENAEIRVDSASEYQKMIDAEWQLLFDKLDAIVQSGAQIVLSRLAIGDIATQYFADRGVFCAGRVEENDLKRTAAATGARILTTVSNITDSAKGTCASFEERQVGNERYNVFKGCPKSGVTTIVLRGGARQFIEEAERSLNDAVMTCARALQSKAVVGGGGAVEIELSQFLKREAMKIEGKQQLVVEAFSRALQVIPRVLALNSGLDASEVINRLCNLHSNDPQANRWMGVDCKGSDASGGVMDTVKGFVWEPILVKVNALSSATEAACCVLSVDEMIRNPKSNPDPAEVGPRPQQGGRAVRY